MPPKKTSERAGHDRVSIKRCLSLKTLILFKNRQVISDAVRVDEVL